MSGGTKRECRSTVDERWCKGGNANEPHTHPVLLLVAGHGSVLRGQRLRVAGLAHRARDVSAAPLLAACRWRAPLFLLVCRVVLVARGRQADKPELQVHRTHDLASRCSDRGI
jgi:hypothetical protein